MRRLASSAAFGMIVAVALLITGGLGSLYSEQIKLGWPFSWLDGRAPGHIIFWIAVVASGLMFFSRQWAVDRRRERTQSEMMGLAGDLMETIRTMPPEGFLEEFAAVYEDAENLLNAVLAAPPVDREPDVIARAIRQVLRSIAVLAAKFDRNSEGASHSANIMIFRPSTKIEVSEAPTLEARLHFCAEEPKVTALRGLLDLRKDLSTTARSEEAVPNERLSDAFALPIPKRMRSNSIRNADGDLRWRVLPGAPVAFALGTFSHVPDTLLIDEWCSENTVLSDEIALIKDYFESGAGEYLRSFISIAVMPPPFVTADAMGEDVDEHFEQDQAATTSVAGTTEEMGDAPEPPMAILNIDSDRVNLLRGSEKTLSQFYFAVTPFRLILSRLLAALQECERQPQVAGPTPEADSTVAGA